MANSMTELTELLRTRLCDILFKEAANDGMIYLYLADGYWTAFEKSAFRLSRLYAPALLVPMRLPSMPVPFVTASVGQESLRAAMAGADCLSRVGRERAYTSPAADNADTYRKWHDRETKALRCLPAKFTM